MALRRYRLQVLVGFDVVTLLASFVLMTRLRYAGAPVPTPWGHVMLAALLAAAVLLAVGLLTKTYRGRVAVASVEETIALSGAVIVGIAVVLVAVVASPLSLARTVPLAAGFTALATMLTCRAVWRRLCSRIGWTTPSEARRAVIVGADETSAALIRSIWQAGDAPFVPVALLDDDRWKRFRRIEGVPVVGVVDDLAGVLRWIDADVVIVGIRQASSEFLSRVNDAAAAAGVPVKVLPSLAEMFGDEVTIRDVRDIDLADVLGRQPIQTDLAGIADIIAGKRVLVTGAGGSIGSELCRQIANCGPAELMMLDRDESALHGVQLALYGHGLLNTDEVILADIRDADAVDTIFRNRRPEVVFHAAALKHLPMLEQYPLEGLKTNVLGTLNVLEASRRVGVERFVNISTDKAADPTSVLGLSKRVAERLTAGYGPLGDGVYLSVRFGNVLGSRGSVLTAWAAQIAAGGPVTVTDKDVTRYFMTIAEACQLVLQAGAIGAPGETLILDMGEPVRLDDVARSLIAKSGKRIEIVYTGLRPGEKLDEILMGHGEADARPHHPLVSHVAVPPIDSDAVRAAATRGSDVRARDLLRGWCDADAFLPLSDAAAHG